MSAAEAICGPNKLFWKETMEQELVSFKKNNNTLVEATKGRQSSLTKWVFKIKTNIKQAIQDQMGCKRLCSNCGY